MQNQLTADVVEGIIAFADKHPSIDRQDIACELLDAEAHGFEVENEEWDRIVSFLEHRLVRFDPEFAE